MRVLLLEDEPLAAKRTRGYLARYGRGLAEAGWCQSVDDAHSWLAEHPAPDLLVSDIELLDGNVFRLFDEVDLPAPVVFATAYDQFLLRAFEANGVGYLLKPYTYEQFAAAMDKVLALFGLGENQGARHQPAGLSADTVAALREALRGERAQYRTRFTARRSSGVTILPVEEVAMLLSEDKVTFAVDARGRRHPLNQTLTTLAEQLDPGAWFRVNRAELVHLPFVERFEPYGRDRVAVHLRGVQGAAVVSRERTPEFRRWVEG